MSVAPRAQTVAVLPVKRFVAAKARLAGELSAGTRRALAEAMLADVLLALRRTAAVDAVLVVTGEPAAAALAAGHGAAVVADELEDGQSAAALIGLRRASELGATRALLVPGDCPALDPAELAALLEPQPAPSVTLVPDRHGDGTNALVLDPPDAIAPAFGPDSRARHERAAADAGVPCRIERPATLLVDVDTGADVEALRRLLAERRGGAAHTRGLLARLAAREAAAPRAGSAGDGATPRGAGSRGRRSLAGGGAGEPPP